MFPGLLTYCEYAPRVATVLVVSTELSRDVLVPLAEDGYSVVEGDTTYGALQQAKRRSPDVVIMPDDLEPEQGIDPLHAVRRDVDAIIIAVGTGKANKISEALFRGADAYVTHPIDRAELRGRLRSLLRRRTTMRRSASGRAGPPESSVPQADRSVP